jgi:hypothetical protein
MNDFKPKPNDFVYPSTSYTNAPLMYQSHAEFLQAGALRYHINVAMHGLSVAQLRAILENVKSYEPELTDSGEK